MSEAVVNVRYISLYDFRELPVNREVSADGLQGMEFQFRDVTDRKKAEEALKRNEMELTKRVKELEEFYDIAVGRELRMVKLKKEIAKLEKEFEKYKQQ